MNSLLAIQLPGLLAALPSWEQVLRVMLWLGLGGLTIALIALARTRWGQARPLTKCVALSVAAHILFLFYAYGTRLAFGPAGWGDGSDFVRLSIDSIENYEEAPTAATIPDQPWDNVAKYSAPADIQAPALLRPTDASPATQIEQPPVPPAKTEMEVERPVPPLLSKNVATESAVSPAPFEDTATNAPPPEKVVTNSIPASHDTATSSIANDSGAANAAHIQEATSGAATKRIDGQEIPEVYQRRASPSRLSIALRFGGSRDTEAAVRSALDWLAAHQSADGRWDAGSFGAGKEARIHGHDRGGAGAHADTGITALALLAFLGAGHHHLEGEHREVVQFGLEYLLRNQRSDGCLAGPAELFASMYCHGMALLALSEAYAITGDDRIRPFVERGVQYTIQSQHTSTGGWRYQPGDSGDMSQFGWQVMALVSAEKAGIEIPLAVRTRMLKFLKSASSGVAGGLASYRPGERVSPTMTAEAFVCRAFLKQATSEQMEEAQDYLSDHLPGRDQDNAYYWYYGTLAMFQMQGSAWPNWNESMKRKLLQLQRRGGDIDGSWDPDAVWGNYGGRVFSTALSAMCLEVYYRYLPLYGDDGK